MNPLEFTLPGTKNKTRCWIKPAQPENLDTTQYEVYLNNKFTANVFIDENGAWRQFSGKALSEENIVFIGSKIKNFVALMRQMNRFFSVSTQTHTHSNSIYNNTDSFQAAISI